MTETKTCPMCAEVILVGALRCRHCGEVFDGRPKPGNEFRQLAILFMIVLVFVIVMSYAGGY